MMKSLPVFFLMSATSLMALEGSQLQEIRNFLAANPVGWYKASAQHFLSQVNLDLPSARGAAAQELSQMASGLQIRIQSPATPPPPPPPPAGFTPRRIVTTPQEQPAQPRQGRITPTRTAEQQRQDAELAAAVTNPRLRSRTPSQSLEMSRENMITNLRNQINAYQQELSTRPQLFRRRELERIIPEAQERLDTLEAQR